MTKTGYQDCIMFNLAKAYQRVHGEFKDRCSELGLTPTQLLVLEALYEEEDLSSGEIGKRLVLDSATLSGVLERMAESGWISKEPSARDRRILKIRPTPKAREMEQSLLALVNEVNGLVMEPLNLEEGLLLKRLLKDLSGRRL